MSLLLFIIFQVIFFNEVSKFVYPMMVWSCKLAVEFLRRVELLVIREDLIKTTFSVLLRIVSVTALETLELGLGQL
jgi:hypothetical protein